MLLSLGAAVDPSVSPDVNPDLNPRSLKKGKVEALAWAVLLSAGAADPSVRRYRNPDLNAKRKRVKDTKENKKEKTLSPCLGAVAVSGCGGGPLGESGGDGAVRHLVEGRSGGVLQTDTGSGGVEEQVDAGAWEGRKRTG